MKLTQIKLAALLILISNAALLGQPKYEIYYLHGSYDSIINVAGKIIGEKKADSDTYFWIASALQKKGNLKFCCQVLEECKQIFGENNRILQLLADTYFEMGNYLKAEPILEKYKDKKDNIPKLVKIYDFKGNYWKSVHLLEDLINSDTSNILYLKLLANSYLNVDSVSKAIKFYELVYKQSPEDQLSAYRLAQLYLNNDEYEKAVNICGLVLQYDSINIKFIKLNGQVFYKRGKFDDAIKYFTKAYTLGDTGKFVLKHLGISEIKEYYFYESQEHLSKAYLLDTTDATVCFYLGKAFLGSRFKEKGLSYLNKAEFIIQPNPEFIGAIYNEKASIYIDLKRYDEALNSYQIAYNALKSPEYLYYMASLYHGKLKNKLMAYKYYKLFLKDLPPRDTTINSFTPQQTTISLQKLAEEYLAQLKEELFFEGKQVDQ